jgi:hypothetical protein
MPERVDWEPNPYATYGIFFAKDQNRSPALPMPASVDWELIALGSWEINHMLLVGYMEID